MHMQTVASLTLCLSSDWFPVFLLVYHRSEATGLPGWHVGLLLLWCSVHAAGHLLPCTGTHAHTNTPHMLIFSSQNSVLTCACVSAGKGAVSASVGSASLQKHHHAQPQTGRGSVSTPGKSSSFYHSDAANTTGTHISTPFLFLSFYYRSVRFSTSQFGAVNSDLACVSTANHIHAL